VRVAVLASGNGSNLQALLDAQLRGEIAPANIAVVVSNVATAPALQRASKHHIPHHAIAHQSLPDREAFDRAVVEVLQRYQVELVVLAGFMRILSPWFVQQYPQRIINTHPSLLPAFVGSNAPAQALAYGAKVTGVSIHFVDESLDGGPVIAQRAVLVAANDTVTTLHQRILQQEHQLLPQVVRDFANDRIHVENRTVTVVEPCS
jgi:phosphoribosylglycinamide formyltransferase 1